MQPFASEQFHAITSAKPECVWDALTATGVPLCYLHAAGPTSLSRSDLANAYNVELGITPATAGTLGRPTLTSANRSANAQFISSDLSADGQARH